MVTFNECGFNERIKALRKGKKYTQQQLADKFQVTKSVISYYENSSKAPSPDILILYADEFNVSVDYLFGREKPKSNVIDVNGLSNEEIKVVQTLINTLKKK